MKKTFTASSIRILLSLLLLLSLAGIVGGSYAAYSFLQSTAQEVNRMQTEAMAVDAKIKNLLSLNKQLDDNASTAKKAAQIAAESKSYQYQNQIINDLSIYANKAGVPIQSFTFQGSNTPAKSSSSSTPSSSATPKAATVDGVKSTVVSVQLGDKVPYTSLLHFLHLIESNITRMQISGVSISRAENNGEVSIQSLDIGVYVR